MVVAVQLHCNIQESSGGHQRVLPGQNTRGMQEDGSRQNKPLPPLAKEFEGGDSRENRL
jgi:hypothetical protein